MDEVSPIDIWAERLPQLRELVGRLTPHQALEVLQVVIRDCDRGDLLSAYLSGSLIGIAERRHDAGKD